jgi:signal transduction histidine kinase
VIENTSKFKTEEIEIVSNAVEETLNKKFEAMRDVSTMLAHDLRNPLAGIKNSAYILKKKYSQNMDERGKSIIEMIEDCVEYSDKIVQDLLDFSSKINLERTKTTPKKLMDSSLSKFLISSKIQVINETSDKFSFFVDATRIMRVFSNLIKNAFDAMPNGGKLVITSRKVKNQIVIEFSDSGTGISEETLEMLWTPFLTTKAKGMGIGLSICKRIIDAHSGRIEVKSALNVGTTFSVYLPME